MNDFNSQGDLQRSLDLHLAALSKIYGRDGDEHLQQVIVNARPLLVANNYHDQWNPDITWYDLYLMLPEKLFLSADADRNQISNRIQVDLNRIHGLEKETVRRVLIQLDMGEEHDWRSESGSLLNNRRMVTEEQKQDIWQEEGLRVFISHRSSVKAETYRLKQRLSELGVTCFVAHEDIEPTKEWETTILQALASMDAFLAIVTQDYHSSVWTDQEVGYATASGVPVVSASIDSDPRGFIARYQAVRCNWDNAHLKIVPVLFNLPKMIDAFIYAVKKCPDYDTGLMLALMLDNLSGLSDEQIDRLVDAYNGNRQIYECFGFNGKGYKNGPGLVHYLNQLSQRQYEYGRNSLIKLKT